MMTLIGQILGCLIVAAAIGMAMGWFLRSFTTSEKRQQLSEIAARLRGREHEMDSLHHELKVRTSAVQILESKMVAAEAALKDLQAEATAKGEQIETLQNELADKSGSANALMRETETLRQALTEAERTLDDRNKGLADLQGELEVVQELMVRRDQEIATLKTWVDQLEVKEVEIGRLRGRVTELESLQDQLAATEKRLSDSDQRAQKAQAERDALDARLRAHLEEARVERASHEERVQAQAAEHLANLREQEDLARRLREESKEVETLRHELSAKQAQLAQAEERRVLDISEREEEIAALRRRLVEYRVAQGLVGKATTRQSGAPAPDKAAAKPVNDSGPSKDDLKKIHGIGPVIERVLNRMGTHTFLQIAQWDHTDIERVAVKLNTFPDRIVRDNWIEGAKEQHYLKYGERL
jgi:predicted flap endonuclease-1-like 5' DNA nuclease/predicted  nucleic acid-binding Zn-ribbon protein